MALRVPDPNWPGPRCPATTSSTVKMGGTVSAEHGIGRMKKALLKEMYSEKDINQMMELKRCFDPDLLNPGDIFDAT